MSDGLSHWSSPQRRMGLLASIATASLALMAGVVPVASADVSALIETDNAVIRWGGADRYEVSANISRQNFTDGANTVYIANGLASADALAAGPVAGINHGPVLLVKKDSIPTVVASELDRLSPTTVVILGGTGSVSAILESELQTYATSVSRWGGADRYEVSANVSQTNFDPGVGTVYVANGLASADALAAGPVAGMNEGPILLLRTDSIPAAVAAELDRLQATRIVVLGGTASVSASVESRLLTYAGSVTRWGGADRYEVSAKISRTTFPNGWPTVYVSNGLASADALAVGPVATMDRGPILLVKRDTIPRAVAAEISRLGPTRIVILGGTGSVSATVEGRLRNIVDPLTVTTTIPAGVVDSPFPTSTLSATGGTAPYTWSASNLPAGLSLSASGILSGTPSSAGTFSVEFTVRDAVQIPATATRTIVILPALTHPFRVSVAPDGAAPDNYVLTPAPVSGDGRFVAYGSYATNLVPDDLNEHVDVFLWDRDTRTTTLVSVAPDGTQANGDSPFNNLGLTMSVDGRYVAYASRASNLVPDDTNNTIDVFVWDSATQSTLRITGPTGGTSPSISADGRYVAYESADGGTRLIFLWDRDTGLTTRVSTGHDSADPDGNCENPSISEDGRWVAYESTATNLSDGDTNEERDVFLWDRLAGTTVQASSAIEPSNYYYEASVSADGRYVTYQSDSSGHVPGDTNNVLDVFLWDRDTGRTTLISAASDGAPADSESSSPMISADGRFVTYESFASNLVPWDTNGFEDVVVWDRLTGTTTLANVTSDGTPSSGYSAGPSISADGSFLTYESYEWGMGNPVITLNRNPLLE